VSAVSGVLRQDLITVSSDTFGIFYQTNP
jgi:hypothetical protein